MKVSHDDSPHAIFLLPCNFFPNHTLIHAIIYANKEETFLFRCQGTDTHGTFSTLPNQHSIVDNKLTRVLVGNYDELCESKYFVLLRFTIPRFQVYHTNFSYSLRFSLVVLPFHLHCCYHLCKKL